MKKKILYEIIFSVLSVIAVTIAVLDISEKISLTKDSIYFYIDLSITIIFIFDYFIRLILSDNKKVFVKQNIPDLIAMIPFNALKVFRLVKILKIIKILKFVRLFGVSAKFYRSTKRFLHTNGLI
jgi:voltage-gated potassium channel